MHWRRLAPGVVLALAVIVPSALPSVEVGGKYRFRFRMVANERHGPPTDPAELDEEKAVKSVVTDLCYGPLAGAMQKAMAAMDRLNRTSRKPFTVNSDNNMVFVIDATAPYTNPPAFGWHKKGAPDRRPGPGKVPVDKLTGEVEAFVWVSAGGMSDAAERSAADVAKRLAAPMREQLTQAAAFFEVATLAAATQEELEKKGLGAIALTEADFRGGMGETEAFSRGFEIAVALNIYIDLLFRGAVGLSAIGATYPWASGMKDAGDDVPSLAYLAELWQRRTTSRFQSGRNVAERFGARHADPALESPEKGTKNAAPQLKPYDKMKGTPALVALVLVDWIRSGLTNPQTIRLLMKSPPKTGPVNSLDSLAKALTSGQFAGGSEKSKKRFEEQLGFQKALRFHGMDLPGSREFSTLFEQHAHHHVNTVLYQRQLEDAIKKKFVHVQEIHGVPSLKSAFGGRRILRLAAVFFNAFLTGTYASTMIASGKASTIDELVTEATAHLTDPGYWKLLVGHGALALLAENAFAPAVNKIGEKIEIFGVERTAGLLQRQFDTIGGGLQKLAGSHGVHRLGGAFTVIVAEVLMTQFLSHSWDFSKDGSAWEIGAHVMKNLFDPCTFTHDKVIDVAIALVAYEIVTKVALALSTAVTGGFSLIIYTGVTLIVAYASAVVGHEVILAYRKAEFAGRVVDQHIVENGVKYLVYEHQKTVLEKPLLLRDDPVNEIQKETALMSVPALALHRDVLSVAKLDEMKRSIGTEGLVALDLAATIEERRKAIRKLLGEIGPMPPVKDPCAPEAGHGAPAAQHDQAGGHAANKEPAKTVIAGAFADAVKVRDEQLRTQMERLGLKIGELQKEMEKRQAEFMVAADPFGKAVGPYYLATLFGEDAAGHAIPAEEIADTVLYIGLVHDKVGAFLESRFPSFRALADHEPSEDATKEEIEKHDQGLEKLRAEVAKMLDEELEKLTATTLHQAHVLAVNNLKIFRRDAQAKFREAFGKWRDAVEHDGKEFLQRCEVLAREEANHLRVILANFMVPMLLKVATGGDIEKVRGGLATLDQAKVQEAGGEGATPAGESVPELIAKLQVPADDEGYRKLIVFLVERLRAVRELERVFKAVVEMPAMSLPEEEPEE